MVRGLTRQEEEAERHDRTMDERSGRGVQEPTREEKKLMEKRQEERKISEENTRNQLLEKFTNFITDPLKYLHEQVSLGEWSNMNERYQLYSLLTAIRTQQALESVVSLLKARK